MSESNVRRPSTWTIPFVVQEALQISPKNIAGKPFTSEGIAYEMSFLVSLRKKLYSINPIELQDYADVVCHAFPDAIMEIELPKITKQIVRNLNITAIGSLCYSALNAEDKANRSKAIQLLIEIGSKL